MDWYSILFKYGVTVPDESQFNIHCPFHEDRRESCAINTDKGVWICYAGCGQGSLKSFIQKLSGKSWQEVDYEIEDKTWELDFSFLDELDIGESSTKSLEYGDILKDIPNNHWIYKRGFTAKALAKWNCKVNSYNDLVIPVEDREKNTLGWLTIRIRAIPKYLYSK